jgi:hypothetical protein
VTTHLNNLSNSCLLGPMASDVDFELTFSSSPKQLKKEEQKSVRKSSAWTLFNNYKLYVKDLPPSDFVWKTLKFSKFLNSEYVVLFLDPKLLSKSATKFILGLLNKTFISSFWVGICMGGTLRTQAFKILSTPLSFKYKSAEWKCWMDDLNGSVGSIADLKPKGPGFESRISQGFFLM